MKLPAVIASDLHLTANPAEKYRWGLFPWLAKQCKLEEAQTLLLLGDLTDAKDYHSAELVNSVVGAIKALLLAVPRIIILRGNHDYLKDGHMFFEFLQALPGVEVITKPTEDIDGELCMFLPFTRTPAKDWAGKDFSHYRFLFMHQTVRGAVASNGQKMDGEALPALNAAKVYSGDIHVPQTVGPVEYVGSPYHVHFGDAFKPRCIALDRKGAAFDLHFPSPRRLMIDVNSGDEIPKLQQGDQVKLRVHLAEADKHLWTKARELYKTLVQRSGAELCGIELRVEKSGTRTQPADRLVLDPTEVTYRYVDERQLGSELLDVALECMEANR